MSRTRISKVSAITVGGLITAVATATATPTENDLPRAGYQCRPLGPENRIDPPPPLPPIEGRSPEETDALRRFAEKSKISESPYPGGEVAYPEPYFPTARKHYPPAPRDIEVPVRESTTKSPNQTVGLDDDQNPALTKYRYVSKEYQYPSHGVSIEINVANPDVEDAGLSHSIAQLNVLGEAGDLDTVELGWRVTRWEEGPRLFTYVNKDGYQSHGDPGGDCYNCHFIPLPGAEYIPGQALVPSPNGATTLEFGVRLMDDNWWVWVGDQWIGYLDGNFWPGTTEYSDGHVFYGEVYDDGEGTTDMGNGRWGHQLGSSTMQNPTASYYKNGAWLTLDGPFLPNTATSLWSSAASRYDGYESNGTTSRNWKFGGPGTG